MTTRAISEEEMTLSNENIFRGAILVDDATGDMTVEVSLEN